MNREIKFRAWDEDGYMFDVSGLEFLDGSIIVHEKGTKNFGSLGSGVIALMQYTGVNDKNGKEIYESDIVKFEDPITRKIIIRPVVFISGSYVINYKDDSTGGDITVYVNNTFEVISDIFHVI
jgi:uncharacterized phage protein (TIGR01671 family)